MSLIGGGGGGALEAFDTDFLGACMEEGEGSVLDLLSLLSCGLGGKFGASLVGGGGHLAPGGGLDGGGGREEFGDCPGGGRGGEERPGIGGRGRWLSVAAVVGEIGPSPPFGADLSGGGDPI